MRDYDPVGADTLADPFPKYAALRDRCPVHHNDRFDPPFFTVTRHDDVLGILRDVDTWSSRYGPGPMHTRAGGLVNDPPEHTEFRRLFVRGFTGRTVGALEQAIETLARELLDAMLPLGTGDFYHLYAHPLPMLVIASLLGVPAADLDDFGDMCDALTATYNLPDPAASGPPRARLDAYFQGHLDER
jgi:cytochrome P450